MNGHHSYKPPITTLSPRQLEVLELMKEGYKDREIGDQLYVTRDTVKTHVQNIKIKLGIDQMFSSRVPIVIKALRQGIIKLEEEDEG